MTISDQSPKMPLVQGEPITPLDQFWIDTVRNVTKESVAALEEAAKQLIAIASFSQGIYFAAISFTDLKKAVSQLAWERQWLLVVLLCIPILLWIGSLFFAVRVFKPKTYQTNLDSPDVARESYQEIVTWKHNELQRAYLLLILGFIPLVLNLIIYLIYAPVAP